jgi:hypothetical protein
MFPLRVYDESTMEEIGPGYIFGVGHIFIIRQLGPGKLVVGILKCTKIHMNTSFYIWKTSLINVKHIEFPQVHEGRKRSFLKRLFLSDDRWLPKSENMATLDPHNKLKSRQECPTCFMTKA